MLSIFNFFLEFCHQSWLPFLSSLALASVRMIFHHYLLSTVGFVVVLVIVVVSKVNGFVVIVYTGCLFLPHSPFTFQRGESSLVGSGNGGDSGVIGDDVCSVQFEG